MKTRYYQNGNCFYRIKKKNKNENTIFGNKGKIIHVINLDYLTYADTCKENISGEQVTKDVWQKVLKKIINHLQKQL